MIAWPTHRAKAAAARKRRRDRRPVRQVTGDRSDK